MEKEKVIIKGNPRKVKIDEVIEKEVIKVEVKDPIKEYIDGFNPLQKIAYEIARTRLKTSFDIQKSIGFNSH